MFTSSTRIETVARAAARLFVAAGAILAVMMQQAGQAEDGLSLAKLRVLRDEAKRAERRIIFNNDGWDAFLVQKGLSDEEIIRSFLNKRYEPSETTVGLAGTHVDSVFHCGCTTGTFASHIPQAPGASVYPFSLASFGKPELEPLNILSKWRTANGVELFFSLRMNDSHDGISDANFERMASRFKKDNPRFLVGKVEDRGVKGRNWAAFDYSHPEVRQFILALAEDVLSRYDVDGIELDFERNPPFFKSFYEGGSASEEETKAMTQLVRDIRHTSEIVGLRKKKPLLIAVRVTSSQPMNGAMGLDVAKWLEEGLVDLLIVGGNLQFDHFADAAKYWKQFDAPLYFCLSNVWGEKDLRQSAMAYRGRALQAWDAGADGVYLFNFFPTTVPFDKTLYGNVYNELGKRATLQRLSKVYYPNHENLYNWLHYADSPPNVYSYYFGDNASKYVAEGIPSFCKRHPLALKGEGATASFDVYVADSLDEPRPEVSLKLRVRGVAGQGDVVSEVNGTALPACEVVDGWVTYGGSRDGVFEKGINKVLIRNTTDGTLWLEDARVDVIHGED